jgi:hypothetical protein
MGIEDQSKRMGPWRQLVETHQMGSPRERIPFEVAATDLHLTRHMESSAEVGHTSVSRAAIPAAGAVGPNS